MTSKHILSSVVKQDSDINNITKKFLKRLNGIIHNCFKKIRIHEDSGVSDVTKLLDKRRILRCKTDMESKRELEAVETELADKCAESNYSKIIEEIKDLSCEEGGMNAGRLWKLQKKLFPYKKIHQQPC